MHRSIKYRLRTLNRLTFARLIPDAIKRASPYMRLRSFVLGHEAMYDAEYYVGVESQAVESAVPVSNSIISYLRPRSVIDVGCGTGALLSAFREQGLRVAGLEYSEAALEYCRRRGLAVTKFDIERDDTVSVLSGQKYDVCITTAAGTTVTRSLRPKRARNSFMQDGCGSIATTFAPMDINASV